jgi:hypothetical protein
MMLRFPTGLPRLLAALAALSFLACVFAPSFGAPSENGRGSSTAGVAYVLFPIFIGLLSAGGFLVGLVLRAVLRMLGVEEDASRRYRTAAVALLVIVPLCIALTTSYSRSARTRLRVANARPRVLVASPQVSWEQTAPGPTPPGARQSTLVWATGAWPDDTAGKNLPSYVQNGLGTAAFTLGNKRSVALDVSALRGIYWVHVLPLGTEDTQRRFVAVLSTGPARSRLAMIAVLTANLELQYAELVERWWGSPETCVAAEANPEDAEAVTIGACRTDSTSERRLLRVRLSPDAQK